MPGDASPTDEDAEEATDESGAEDDDVGGEVPIEERVEEQAAGDPEDAAAGVAAADEEAEEGDVGGDEDRSSEAGRGADTVEAVPGPEPGEGVPDDVRTYDRFTKMDGAQYERVNDFLRNRTYITAREWAIARLCADFRTETGVEMTKIGENLPDLVPFMTDTYTPQAVNQARSSFEEKVRKSGATFLYGAMSDFFSADELDEVMYEVTEVAKFLLEVEGVDLTVEEELEAEERISSVMRDVRHSSEELRHEGVACPNCGHEFGVHESVHDHTETEEAETDAGPPSDSSGTGEDSE